LLSKGLVPIPVVIEEVIGTNDDLSKREIFWIKYARDSGAMLTNIADGGCGIVGFKMSAEQRERISVRLTGQKRSPETGKRISLANIGKKKHWSEEAKASYAEKRKYLRGKINRGPKSLEHRLKISRSLKGRSPAIKGKKMTGKALQNVIDARRAQGKRVKMRNDARRMFLSLLRMKS
jgi:hypothetical protein